MRCRCDSTNGYTCSFQVFAGKIDSAEQGLGSRVVKDLSKDTFGKDHVICFLAQCLHVIF